MSASGCSHLVWVGERGQGWWTAGTIRSVAWQHSTAGRGVFCFLPVWPVPLAWTCLPQRILQGSRSPGSASRQSLCAIVGWLLPWQAPSVPPPLNCSASALASPLLRRFVAGGSDMWVRLHDYQTGEEVEVCKGEPPEPTRPAPSAAVIPRRLGVGRSRNSHAGTQSGGRACSQHGPTSFPHHPAQVARHCSPSCPHLQATTARCTMSGLRPAARPTRRAARTGPSASGGQVGTRQRASNGRLGGGRTLCAPAALVQTVGGVLCRSLCPALPPHAHGSPSPAWLQPDVSQTSRQRQQRQQQRKTAAAQQQQQQRTAWDELPARLQCAAWLALGRMYGGRPVCKACAHEGKHEAEGGAGRLREKEFVCRSAVVG